MIKHYLAVILSAILNLDNELCIHKLLILEGEKRCMSLHTPYLYLYVTWQYALLCYRARVLTHHIVDFLGSRRMETGPSSIETLLRPTLAQSNEPSDLHYIAARMS